MLIVGQAAVCYVCKIETSHIDTLDGLHVRGVISLTWKCNRKTVVALLAVLELLSRHPYVILRTAQVYFVHSLGFTCFIQQLSALRLFSAQCTYILIMKSVIWLFVRNIPVFRSVVYEGFEHVIMSKSIF